MTNDEGVRKRTSLKFNRRHLLRAMRTNSELCNLSVEMAINLTASINTAKTNIQ